MPVPQTSSSHASQILHIWNAVPLGNSSRSGTATPTTGSTSQTQTDALAETITTATLRLRGAHDPAEISSERPRIRWAEGVVDNEGLGKKKSKGARALKLAESLRLFFYDGLTFEALFHRSTTQMLILDVGKHSVLHLPRSSRSRRFHFRGRFRE